MTGAPEGATGFKALEIAPRDDVHHTGDCVGAIGRCTANRQIFNAINQLDGDYIQIDLQARSCGAED